MTAEERPCHAPETPASASRNGAGSRPHDDADDAVQAVRSLCERGEQGRQRIGVHAIERVLELGIAFDGEKVMAKVKYPFPGSRAEGSLGNRQELTVRILGEELP